MMNFRPLLYGLGITILVYNLLAAIWGPVGTQAYASLKEEEARLEVNLEELRERGLALQRQRQAFLDLPQYVEVAATNGGMLYPGDQRVILPREGSGHDTWEVGRLVVVRETEGTNLWYLRILALVMGLVGGVITAFWNPGPGLSSPGELRRRSVHQDVGSGVQGIRIQTASLK